MLHFSLQCLFSRSLGAARVSAAVKANIIKRNKRGKERREKRAAHSNNSKFKKKRPRTWSCSFIMAHRACGQRPVRITTLERSPWKQQTATLRESRFGSQLAAFKFRSYSALQLTEEPFTYRVLSAHRVCACAWESTGMWAFRWGYRRICEGRECGPELNVLKLSGEPLYFFFQFQLMKRSHRISGS